MLLLNILLYEHKQNIPLTYEEFLGFFLFLLFSTKDLKQRERVKILLLIETISLVCFESELKTLAMSKKWRRDITRWLCQINITSLS